MSNDNKTTKETPVESTQSPASPTAATQPKSEMEMPDSAKRRRLTEQDKSDLGQAQWPVREFVSRDGDSKLRTGFRFASFDQMSYKARGESACAAIAAVNAHWLLTNPDQHPTEREFDELIMAGSAEWRNLCRHPVHGPDFPNRHFDVETVVSAAVRPLEASVEKSFVGFFGAERFKCLEEVMSVDKIWDEISKDTSAGVGVYIVGWNDHFFVMKAAKDAYYVVDSLGGRLFPGCEKAYILKFDSRSVVLGQGPHGWGPVCEGKDCCREFLKRFLAAVIVGEMAEMAAKGWDPLTDYDLFCSRLQIEFHYMTARSLPSSSSNRSSVSSEYSSSDDDGDSSSSSHGSTIINSFSSAKNLKEDGYNTDEYYNR